MFICHLQLFISFVNHLICSSFHLFNLFCSIIQFVYLFLQKIKIIILARKTANVPILETLKQTRKNFCNKKFYFTKFCELSSIIRKKYYKNICMDSSDGR